MRKVVAVLLVAYDIPDDRRRARVAKALLRFGRRVQYSVFLTERGSAQEIATALGRVIDATVDDIRIHPLCATCDAKALLLGPKAREAGQPAGFRVI
jgi:CRISPR-associated protein Cas2